MVQVLEHFAGATDDGRERVLGDVNRKVRLQSQPLVESFEEHRGPNLRLLATRAQELNTVIKEFRSEQKAEAAP